MKYNEYRNNGWYIGSGSIESANKYIVAQHMKQNGMIWSKKCVNAVIWTRCKYFEGDWDDFWDSINIGEYLNNSYQNMAKVA